MTQPNPNPEERAPRAVGSALEHGEEAEPTPPPPVPAVRVTESPEVEPVAPWAEKLVRFLDDGIRVPGTSFRFGLDAIIGFLLPGAGDMVSGAGSLSLLLLAIKHRVPTVVIARMLINIALDSLLGSVPFAGDAFDLFFKSNRKNLELIERHRDDPDARPSAADYLLVGAGVLLVALSVLIPLLLVAAIGAGLFSLFE